MNIKFKTVTIPTPLSSKEIITLSEKEPKANLYFLNVKNGSLQVESIEQYKLTVSYYADLLKKGEALEPTFYRTQHEVELVIQALKQA